LNQSIDGTPPNHLIDGTQCHWTQTWQVGSSRLPSFVDSQAFLGFTPLLARQNSKRAMRRYLC
jgi:hypothetical protein